MPSRKDNELDIEESRAKRAAKAAMKGDEDEVGIVRRLRHSRLSQSP